MELPPALPLLLPNPTPQSNGSSSVMTEVTGLMKQWDDENAQPTFNPIITLTRLAEIIETETENYLKMDPDPFDERHPSRTDPECKLGLILKALFRKDHFMNRLVNDYLRDTYFTRLNQSGPDRDINQLNISACRLMLDVLPGLEISVVFQPETDSLINRLIKWSTDSIEPLQSYATGLLAAAMELPDIATRFREQNGRLVPLLLQRLRRLQSNSDFFKKGTENNRPFAHLSQQKSPAKIDKVPNKVNKDANIQGTKRTSATFLSPEHHNIPPHAESDYSGGPRKKLKLDNALNGLRSPPGGRNFTESSNSSWAELETFLIGNVQIFPPTPAMRQMLILRYLTPMGEYQEFLSHVFEQHALELILSYANVRETKQARLAFEALKYLAALLCHKKFSIEFIQCGGLEAILEVPRPSIAATGVSICLYYLGYCEEAMERVCLLPKYVVNNLVRYALWLLECSHDSGRCHATMFFGLTFQFKVILEEFDAQDGLRKLHNVISTLPILSGEDHMPSLNEDAECAARQIVRHVCVAYKRYLEAHLQQRVDQLHRAQIRPPAGVDRSPSMPPIISQPDYKACKATPEDVQQKIDTLIQLLPFRAHWHPVDQLLKLGGITLLLKIIAFSYEWNYSGRAETVRCALDVLAIASVMPRVQLLFCERIDLPEEAITVGMNIILGAVEGEIVSDADVQKAALRVIVNCVCSPINRVGGSIARYSSSGITSGSPSKKTKVKSSDELIQKVWESVRSNSGIMVLLHLMNVKTPITDADCIRTLACKALAGLARSDTVRQIVSKLPLFTNGQLQNLMRDPILQEKRQEHVSFQKHALELLERLSGKTKHTGDSLDVSLYNIHRANVVAQTKIQFNDTQLLQLIHRHLVFRGLEDTANLLQKEANLAAIFSSTASTTLHPSKFRYTPTTPITPTRNRVSSLTMHTPNVRTNALVVQATTSTDIITTNSTMHTTTVSPTIKLIKKSNSGGIVSAPATICAPHNSRLQKQISNSEVFMKAATPGQSSAPLFSMQDNTEATSVVEPRITLDSIIIEYLTNQHALCKNPMATCPQFNLFVPHKCPDPKPRNSSANNFALRNARRSMGYSSKQLDRKFIHSRFCPVQTIRLPTDDGFFTCARFMPKDQSIIVGDYTGEVRLFNMYTGNELGMFVAHDSYIVHIEPSWDGELVLTSSTWGRPQSALWSLKSYEIQYPFLEEEHVEFSHCTQDRILGTRGESATIYDTATGTSISKLTPTSSNQYTKNKATFSPNDELVLSDGVLFDVSSGKQIHKLDKLNQTQSGVFHPNGLQIVSNTEVWDLRTFHLLKTVPTLNQCQVVFTPCNSAIYAIATEQLTNEDDPSYDSSFKTLDASDYNSIATIDVKRYVYDLAVNRYDTQIALVENQGQYNSIQESVVRLYDVGRRRDDEDDQEEEEDDDDDIDGSDDDGSDNDGPMVIDLMDGLEGGNSQDDDARDDGDGSDASSDSWTDMSSSSSSDSSFHPDTD